MLQFNRIKNTENFCNLKLGTNHQYIHLHLYSDILAALYHVDVLSFIYQYMFVLGIPGNVLFTPVQVIQLNDEVVGSILSQRPRHTKDVIKMVPVALKGKSWLFLKN